VRWTGSSGRESCMMVAISLSLNASSGAGMIGRALTLDARQRGGRVRLKAAQASIQQPLQCQRRVAGATVREARRVGLVDLDLARRWLPRFETQALNLTGERGVAGDLLPRFLSGARSPGDWVSQR
jgi:hypothetical protein